MTVLAGGERNPLSLPSNIILLINIKYINLVVRATSLYSTVKVLFQIAGICTDAICTNLTNHHLVKPLIPRIIVFFRMLYKIAAWRLNTRGERLRKHDPHTHCIAV